MKAQSKTISDLKHPVAIVIATYAMPPTWRHAWWLGFGFGFGMGIWDGALGLGEVFRLAHRHKVAQTESLPQTHFLRPTVRPSVQPFWPFWPFSCHPLALGCCAFDVALLSPLSLLLLMVMLCRSYLCPFADTYSMARTRPRYRYDTQQNGARV